MNAPARPHGCGRNLCRMLGSGHRTAQMENQLNRRKPHEFSCPRRGPLLPGAVPEEAYNVIVGNPLNGPARFCHECGTCLRPAVASLAAAGHGHAPFSSRQFFARGAGADALAELAYAIAEEANILKHLRNEPAWREAALDARAAALQLTAKAEQDGLHAARDELKNIRSRCNACHQAFQRR